MLNFLGEHYYYIPCSLQSKKKQKKYSSVLSHSFSSLNSCIFFGKNFILFDFFFIEGFTYLKVIRNYKAVGYFHHMSPAKAGTHIIDPSSIQRLSHAWCFQVDLNIGPLDCEFNALFIVKHGTKKYGTNI